MTPDLKFPLTIFCRGDLIFEGVYFGFEESSSIFCNISFCIVGAAAVFLVVAILGESTDLKLLLSSSKRSF